MSPRDVVANEDDEGKDHSKELEELIQELSIIEGVDEALAEITVLQSIYGETSVRRWHGDPKGAPNSAEVPDGRIRYEVHTRLSEDVDDGDTHIRILVSLPRSYPKNGPPQLQLLSRYIGAFGVDSTLFGSVLRTYISQDGIEWIPDSVCVFDGIENIKERCNRWYSERLSERKTSSILRDDVKERAQSQKVQRPEDEVDDSHFQFDDSQPSNLGPSLPPGIEIAIADAVVDRKSVFVGRACRITEPSQVPIVLSHLMSDRRIARAAHPIINAWRCTTHGVLYQDNDDDGESAAGGRLAHLLQILEVDHVLVVVTRYFGGVLLGADRFKHINQAARNALEVGGFLDQEEQEKKSTRAKKKH